MLPDNILQLMMDGLVADGVAVRDGDAYKLVPVTIYNINQFVDDHKLKIKQASPEVQSVICEMLGIINSNESDEDEKQAALVTMVEAIVGLNNC